MKVSRLMAGQPALAPQPERRLHSRDGAFINATLRSSHGDAGPARMRDISPFGCNLLVDADWLRNGAFVSVRPDDHSPISGVIRWARDGMCGIEFLRPLHPDLARMLADD